MEERNCGKIELILGPMFSGKSTRLIETIRKSVYKNKKSIMIKFIGDQRYSKKSEVVTHDLIKYDSIECSNLTDSFDTIKNYDIIGVDEGQFFPDLVENSEKLAQLNKTVIIAALNGDFRMEPFPVIARIIPKADKIKLLKAYCFNCHRDAKFSLRIVQSNETEKGNLNINQIIEAENKKKIEMKEKEFEKEDKDTSFSGEETSSSTKEVIIIGENKAQ